MNIKEKIDRGIPFTQAEYDELPPILRPYAKLITDGGHVLTPLEALNKKVFELEERVAEIRRFLQL